MLRGCHLQWLMAEQFVKVGAHPKKTTGHVSRNYCWSWALGFFAGFQSSGSTLIPLNVGCHAIIFEKTEHPWEGPLFLVKGLGPQQWLVGVGPGWVFSSTHSFPVCQSSFLLRKIISLTKPRSLQTNLARGTNSQPCPLLCPQSPVFFAKR